MATRAWHAESYESDAHVREGDCEAVHNLNQPRMRRLETFDGGAQPLERARCLLRLALTAHRLMHGGIGKKRNAVRVLAMSRCQWRNLSLQLREQKEELLPRLSGQVLRFL